MIEETILSVVTIKMRDGSVRKFEKTPGDYIVRCQGGVVLVVDRDEPSNHVSIPLDLVAEVIENQGVSSSTRFPGD